MITTDDPHGDSDVQADGRHSVAGTRGFSRHENHSKRWRPTAASAPGGRAAGGRASSRAPLQGTRAAESAANTAAGLWCQKVQQCAATDCVLMQSGVLPRG